MIGAVVISPRTLFSSFWNVRKTSAYGVSDSPSARRWERRFAATGSNEWSGNFFVCIRIGSPSPWISWLSPRRPSMPTVSTLPRCSANWPHYFEKSMPGPSCSEYARQAVLLHGAFRGSLLAVKRIARCHPLCAGGVDLVPEPGKAQSTSISSGEQNDG